MRGLLTSRTGLWHRTHALNQGAYSGVYLKEQGRAAKEGHDLSIQAMTASTPQILWPLCMLSCLTCFPVGCLLDIQPFAMCVDILLIDTHATMLHPTHPASSKAQAVTRDSGFMRGQLTPVTLRTHKITNLCIT